MYFGVAGALILILVVLILFSIGAFENKGEVQKFSIDDECSLIMGSILHNIRDGGECKIKCANNCEIREMTFHDSEFFLQNASCHTCDCYCI